MHKTTNKDLVKLKRHNQITVPSNLCKKFNIGVGDYMEIINKGNEIVIKPVKIIDPDQAYFYTKEWQKGEAEIDKEIANGEIVGPFDNVDDFIKELES